MSTPFAIILLILVVIGFATVILVILKKTGKDTGQDEKLKQVHEEMKKIKEEMKGSLEKNLDFLQKQSAATAGMMQRQTTDTAKIVQEVTSKLEKLEATNKQVVGFTDQLQNLERVLTSSKNRGSLGEASLELILSNILPPQAYEMQYKFENGETVDAVVKIKNKILPVDAKFSLDNYRRILNEVNEEKKDRKSVV